MNVIQVIVINLLVTYQEVPTNKFRVRVNHDHDHDDYCHSELQPASGSAAGGGPGPGRARLRQLTVPVTDGHGACDSGLKLAVDKSSSLAACQCHGPPPRAPRRRVIGPSAGAWPSLSESRSVYNLLEHFQSRFQM